MNDYQLERLNTRSFEQLIQALALEILGRKVTVFGDGPDGGREATFSGSINFPTENQNWNGYGIVQAKFKQQPDSRAHKNADWALNELKNEFNKIKPKSTAKGMAAVYLRECPDYYIFATNITLSSNLKTGGKDKITDFLENCKTSHGLKDYSIWDGDQIRRMLDAQADIRTSFLPFIISGDVLALVISNLKLKRADFNNTMLRYLQLELLDDQFAKLSQGGYTDASRVSLSNVFVDLPIDNASNSTNTPINDKKTRLTVLHSIFKEASQVLRPSYQTNPPKRHNEGPVAGRFVLIGGPGQGKTTAGVFACQIMRAAILNKAGCKFDRDVQQALDDVISQSITLPVLSTLRYPLRIDLKKLAGELIKSAEFNEITLLDFLKKQISNRTGTNLDVDDLRKWLHKYPWLLILDGLDEVPASSNRSLMMGVINDFVRVEAHQADADLMIVATTRPQGYSDEFDPHNYSHLNLLSLLPSEALQYGNKLAEARHTGAVTRVESLIDTLAMAIKNPATARLMESPLQVTIMLSLVELGGHPPEQRWQLFQQYYDTIFKREKERNTPFSKILRDYEADVHWIHHRAGWILQQRNAESGSTAARLSHLEFDALVKQRLINRGHIDNQELSLLISQMREAATDRLVLLVGNTAHEIGFEIRSLQEFMAAEHVFDGDDNYIRETLKLIAPYAYWQNVFLFMAGRIFFNKEPLVDSLISICDHLCEPLNNSTYAQSCTGPQLALAMLADDACRKQPANIRRLARLASNLMDYPLIDNHRVLSQQFYREAGAVLRDELSNRLRDNKFKYSAWSLCLELSREEQSWSRQCLEENFPWESDQLNEFLLSHISFVKNTDFGDFFWYQLAKNFRKLSISFLGRLHSDNDLDFLKKYIDPTIAFGIQNIFKRESIEIKSFDGKKFHNSYKNSLKNPNYFDLRMDGQDFSDAHPDWQALALASKFSKAPNIENLCNQIEELLSIDPLPNCGHALPWQFNICIEANRSGISIEDIQSSIRSLNIGTPSNWKKWSSIKSLAISDFAQNEDILKVSLHTFGSVFSCSGWSHSLAPPNEEFSFFEELKNSLPNLYPKRPISESLIFLGSFGLNRIANKITINHAPSIKEFLEISHKTGHGMGREIVWAVVTSDMPTSIKIDLLQNHSGDAINRYWISGINRSNFESAWSAIYEAALAIGKEYEILPALALLPPMSCMKKVEPEVIKNALLGQDSLRQAGILINIGSARWLEEEAETVAKQVLELIVTEPQWIADWINYIDVGGLHGSNIEALLLSLLQLGSESERGYIERKFRPLFSKVVSRRSAPTELPDPAKLRI